MNALDDRLGQPIGQIPLWRCRELLGDEAWRLSDDDVDAIRRHAHAMAHILIEIFLADLARERR